MSPELSAIGDTIRDFVVIGYMMVVRLGVPLMITLGVGNWVRRRLEQPEPAPKPVTATVPAAAKAIPHKA